MNWKQYLGIFVVVVTALVVYSIGIDAYNKHENKKIGK